MYLELSSFKSTFLFAFILIMLAGCDQSQVSWYQKVTLSIPHKNKVLTGSSIMKVTWVKNQSSLHPYPKWQPTITGEMPFTKLANNDYVFSLMRNSMKDLPAWFLLPNNLSAKKISIEELRFVSMSDFASKTICAKDKLFPYILMFGSNRNKENGRLFRNDLMCITIERVENSTPIKTRIFDVLPWLSNFNQEDSFHTRYKLGVKNSQGQELERNVDKRDFIRE